LRGQVGFLFGNIARISVCIGSQMSEKSIFLSTRSLFTLLGYLALQMRDVARISAFTGQYKSKCANIRQILSDFCS
jgi:hypothetical protein